MLINKNCPICREPLYIDPINLPPPVGLTPPAYQPQVPAVPNIATGRSGASSPSSAPIITQQPGPANMVTERSRLLPLPSTPSPQVRPQPSQPHVIHNTASAPQPPPPPFDENDGGLPTYNESNPIMVSLPNPRYRKAFAFHIRCCTESANPAIVIQWLNSSVRNWQFCGFYPDQVVEIHPPYTSDVDLLRIPGSQAALDELQKLRPHAKTMIIKGNMVFVDLQDDSSWGCCFFLLAATLSMPFIGLSYALSCMCYGDRVCDWFAKNFPPLRDRYS